MAGELSAAPRADAGPTFAATVAALSVGQLLCWAALYYGFSSFVLPMMRELAWSKSMLMGAFTVGLGASGLATYAVGMLVDRGHGRAVMTLGALLGAAACAAWSQVHEPWVLYACCAAAGRGDGDDAVRARLQRADPPLSPRATATPSRR